MTSAEINSEQVKELLGWTEKLPKKKKVIFQRLKEYQKILEAKQKRTQIYEWTVLALERQYQRRLCEDRFLISHQQQQSHIQSIQLNIQHCEKQLEQLKQDLQKQQPQLQAARLYATHRNDKYKKRQKQFHSYNKLPIMKTVYKKKYLRAQAKNQQAESQVSELLHKIDTIKANQAQVSQQMRRYQQELNEFQHKIHLIQERIQKNEQLLVKWLKGYSYWHEVMGPICLTVEQRIVAVQHLIQQQNNNNKGGSSSKQQQQLNATLKAFQLICKEYEEKESFGNQQFSLDKVDFDCAKCMQFIEQGKPLPDKSNTADILCEACYQQHRTTMIIKKKLGFLQSNPSKSLSDTSFSSISTTSSSSTASLITPPTSRQPSFVLDPSSLSSPPPPPSVPPKDHHHHLQPSPSAPSKLELLDKRITA
ncbi:hypothetical protein BJ944DRAFT_267055 [Cunninghamella echinulata]|nr:hypothetical protein BJ944DRAFT_267055 [Cunninghamella echinulata]